jgi:hypothetical protein
MRGLLHCLIILSGLMLFIFISPSCEENQDTEGGNDTTGTDPIIEEPYEILKPENVVSKKERLLGISISDSRAGFDSAFILAQQAGIQVVELSFPWDHIETGQGTYVDPNGYLSATQYYGTNNIQVILCIAVINTVRRTAPAYLSAYDYDDPGFIAAFKGMMDWLMAHIPENVTVPAISIGNEVDLLLEGDDWDSYKTFYQEVVSYLKNSYPEHKYGVKTTVMNGVLGDKQAKIQAMNLYSDVVMLNYYPQSDSFRVLEPEMVHQHFVEIVGLFRGKQLWFTEVGYQSGSQYCGSSKTMQGHFYHELFKAWDTFNLNVRCININWLHDQPAGQVGEWALYYGLADPAFIEFLSTLGLRNYDNSDKPAWQQLLTETGIRGWK